MESSKEIIISPVVVETIKTEEDYFNEWFPYYLTHISNL